MFGVVVGFVVVVVLGIVFVEVVSKEVRDDVEVAVIVGEGNDREVPLLGTLQNCCANAFAVPRSVGQSREVQSTNSLVKRLLERNIRVQQPPNGIDQHT